VLVPGCSALLGIDDFKTAANQDAAADTKVIDAPVDMMIDAPLTIQRSCKHLKQAAPATPTGVYMIDPDGNMAGMPAFSVFCDMDKDGGGWTLAMSLPVNQTGLTWTNLVPSFMPPTSPTADTTMVLHHSMIGLTGVNQMMLMAGDRIIKFHYPRPGVVFTNNYRSLTERAAFRIENVPNDAPHTGADRDACGHVGDACTTTDFAAFKAADPACPRDATNSHTAPGCMGNCGTFGHCPGMGSTPPMPTPNCLFFGGLNAHLIPNISPCPQASQAPWGNYQPGMLTGFYTLWVR
jgi:hypothetical protein